MPQATNSLKSKLLPQIPITPSQPLQRHLGQQKEGQGFVARNRGGKITGSTRPGKQPEVIGSEPELLLIV